MASLEDQTPAKNSGSIAQQAALCLACPDLVELDAFVASRHDDAAFFLRSASPPLTFALLPSPPPVAAAAAVSADPSPPLVIRPARESHGPQSPATAIAQISVHPTVVSPGNADDAIATRPGKDGDPDAMFWLSVAKGGAKLPLGLGPNQAGDLGKDINESQGGAAAGVEEVDLAVIAAAAGGEEIRLPGCKGHCFDRCRVRKCVGLKATAVSDEDWGEMWGRRPRLREDAAFVCGLLSWLSAVGRSWWRQRKVAR